MNVVGNARAIRIVTCGLQNPSVNVAGLNPLFQRREARRVGRFTSGLQEFRWKIGPGFKSEIPLTARGHVATDHGGFDWNGAAAAKGVDQRLARLPETQQDHRSSERFFERCRGDMRAIPASMETASGRVDR